MAWHGMGYLLDSFLARPLHIFLFLPILLQKTIQPTLGVFLLPPLLSLNSFLFKTLIPFFFSINNPAS